MNLILQFFICMAMTNVVLATWKCCCVKDLNHNQCDKLSVSCAMMLQYHGKDVRYDTSNNWAWSTDDSTGKTFEDCCGVQMDIKCQAI